MLRVSDFIENWIWIIIFRLDMLEKLKFLVPLSIANKYCIRYCICTSTLVSRKNLNGYFGKSKDPDEMLQKVAFHQGLHFFWGQNNLHCQTEIYHNLEILICDPLQYMMDNPILIAFVCMGNPFSVQRLKCKYLDWLDQTAW